MTALDDLYERLLQEAGADPDVVGVVLTGSRGKGFAGPHSDYDVVLFVRDGLAARYEERYRDRPADFELTVTTMEAFRGHAAVGGPLEWDRYAWAHLVPPLDRTGGELQALMDEKGRLSEAEAAAVAGRWLDGYVNHVYRSIKSLRDGNDLGFRLEAADSVTPLLTLLFAFHGRVRPYHRYLAWELSTRPLLRLAMNGDELVRRVEGVLRTGDRASQQLLLGETRRLAREAGFGGVLDAWAGKDEWARTFVSPDQT